MTETPPPQPTAKPRWQTLLRWALWPLALFGALAGIAIVAFLGMELGRETPAQAPVVAKAGAEHTFVVGSVQPLAGTRYLAIEIAEAGDERYASKSSGGGIRNLLFLDVDTGQSRRVLPDNMHKIDDVQFLPGNPGKSADLQTDGEIKNQPRFYLLQLSDPEKPEAPGDILVGTIASGDQSIVMRGISRIDHLQMLDANRAAPDRARKGQAAVPRDRSAHAQGAPIQPDRHWVAP